MKQILPLVIAPVVILTGCNSSPAPSSGATAPSIVAKPAPKIVQFYAYPSTIPKGESGSLCYGVEGASKLTLEPPIDKVWPAPTRCLQIRPEKPTRYTLTATSDDGQSDSKSVQVGSVELPPEPRLYDLWVNALEVGAGEQVKICFKTENAEDVQISAGQLYKDAGCLTDYPKSTSTYKITAVGKGGGRDSRNVTVKVR